jgi:hypothetical protein
MPLGSDAIQQVIERYSRERDRYRKLTRVVEKLCVSRSIESYGVLANITARTKSLASLWKITNPHAGKGRETRVERG